MSTIFSRPGTCSRTFPSIQYWPLACHIVAASRGIVVSILNYALNQASPKAGGPQAAAPLDGTNLPVFRTINARLTALSAALDLTKHIRDQLEVFQVTGDGVNFRAKDAKALQAAIRDAKTNDGERAFADPQTLEKDHWPLQMSMAATKGAGYREIRGIAVPPKASLSLPDLRSDFPEQQWRDFAANFGEDLTVDLYSLHFAVSPDLCNVHLDKTGFTVRLPDGSIVLTPDMLHHIGNELLLKTNFKALMPQRLKWVIDRISLVLPNAANGYARAGPRGSQIKSAMEDFGKMPVGRQIGAIPGVRGVLGGAGEVVGTLSGLAGLSNVPLPGLSIDLIQRKDLVVSVVGSCGVHNANDCSITLNAKGRWR